VAGMIMPMKIAMTQSEIETANFQLENIDVEKQN